MSDLIDRQAVLDLAKKGILVGNSNYKSVCNAINDLPSIEPIRQTRDKDLIKVIREQDCLIVKLYNYAAENRYTDIFNMIDEFLFADRKDLDGGQG